MDDADPPGLDRTALAAWMSAAGQPVGGGITATLLAGGRSNITYRLDDEAGATWVLRRPPLGHVMPTAHDMGREFTVMSALNSVSYPTPHALAFCEDSAIIGAPFMVMDTLILSRGIP